MKLSICIPTHHGRVETLRHLLTTILEQRDLRVNDAIEICISDNASHDGTTDMVAAFQRSSQFPITYHRFDQDLRGVRNFCHCVDMASGEYCWFIGSDDALLETAVATILRTLEREPTLPGLTANKINFDSTLQGYLGVDHDLALPPEPWRTRRIAPAGDALEQIGTAFGYMSTTVFRRADWQSIVSANGIDGLLRFRHFIHTFIWAQLVMRAKGWFWLADVVVIQRLDNFCIREDRDAGTAAAEITQDFLAVMAATVEPSSRICLTIRTKLFLLYWNPVLVLGYLSSPTLTAESRRELRRKCVGWFRQLPWFWLTSGPLWLIPSPILRRCLGLAMALERRMRAKPINLQHPASPSLMSRLFRASLRLLRLENSPGLHVADGHAAAMKYLDARQRLMRTRAE